MPKIVWKKRGAKILGSFFNGYGASWVTVFTVANWQHWQLDVTTLFFVPVIGGLGMTWPQIAKVLFEYGNTR